MTWALRPRRLGHTSRSYRNDPKLKFPPATSYYIQLDLLERAPFIAIASLFFNLRFSDKSSPKIDDWIKLSAVKYILLHSTD